MEEESSANKPELELELARHYCTRGGHVAIIGGWNRDGTAWGTIAQKGIGRWYQGGKSYGGIEANDLVRQATEEEVHHARLSGPGPSEGR